MTEFGVIHIYFQRGRPFQYIPSEKKQTSELFVPTQASPSHKPATSDKPATSHKLVENLLPEHNTTPEEAIPAKTSKPWYHWFRRTHKKSSPANVAPKTRWFNWNWFSRTQPATARFNWFSFRRKKGGRWTRKRTRRFS